MTVRCILCGGPADMQVQTTDTLQMVLEVDGERYNLAYDSRTNEPLTDAFGRLQYRWRWQTGDSRAIEQELDERAANPRPNSKGQRRA